MHPVRSTYKVLAERAVAATHGEAWVDWAIEMIEAGFESEHLYILAGLTQPFNGFELNDIVDRTLSELKIEKGTQSESVFGYAYFLICEALDGKLALFDALTKLKELCVSFDMAQELMDFYLLFYAYDDLKDQGVQFYWTGATMENIEAIARDVFASWKKQYELSPPGSD